MQTRSQRALNLLPAAIFVGTFGVFFVDKNREARTVFRSGRGLLVTAAIAVGYVAIGWLTRRVRWSWAAPVASAIVVLGLAAWIVRPYYVDSTANRVLVAGPIAAAGALSRGELQGRGHHASGRASVIDDNGRRVVRFENFDIEGAPDPRVWVVPRRDADRPDGGVELGHLTGNRGTTLDYAVPAGVTPGPDWTVLVWCRAFAVPIALATQSAQSAQSG